MATNEPTGFDELFASFQGAVAGRYSLERELGRGGMGIVYLAREVRLDRMVAIKLLPPKLSTMKERFLREARTAAKLSHPHVIPIYSVEELGEFVFFVMAYVDGITLGARVRERGPLPPSEATKVLREVAWALAYAHEQGVIHRDVKPDNIMMENGSGRAYVADFGIAGQVKDATTWQGGEVIGTPEFMSPEQALGEDIDHRSDLYSLGAVAFYSLSARLPFEAPTISEVLAKQISNEAPALTSIAPGVPRRIAQIVDQCMAKDRQDRPQSAGQLGEILSRTLEHRKELPLALRAFVKHDSRFDGPAVILYPFIALGGAGAVGFPLGMTAAWGTLIAAMTVVPIGVLISRARKMLRLGFQQGDLAVAFKSEIERGQEERTFLTGQKVTVVERLLKAGGIVAVTLFPVVMGSIVVFGVLGVVPVIGEVVNTFLPYVAMAMMGGMLCGVGYLTLLQRRKDVDTEVWGRLWTGRIGKWLFKVARTFLPAKALPSAMTHRPTEMVIALAADQLFSDLPKHARKGLEDLPNVVARLEGDARRMRARLEELQDTMIDDLGAKDERTTNLMAELRAEREKLQKSLADTVAALETIRLSLLHLHAGKTNVRSLTTDLGRAREIADDVDRLMSGAREVSLILKNRPASSRTPVS